MKNIKFIFTLFILQILFSCNQEKFYQKKYLKQNSKYPKEMQPNEKVNINNNTETNTNKNKNKYANNNPRHSSDNNMNNNKINNSLHSNNQNNNVINNTNNKNKSSINNPVTKTSSCNVTNITEHFSIKKQTSKIDIIWIIDNSGSMEDEQDSLRKNLSMFIQNFIDQNIDFKMTVIPTDFSRYNYLYAPMTVELNSKMASDDIEDFLYKFQKAVSVGTSGSGQEKGFHSTLNFLKQYAKHFIRPDANLATIFLSDENDQSFESSKKFSLELSKFKNLNKVRSYSIISKDKNYLKHWESVGTKYIEFSNKVGGNVLDLHKDFYKNLNIISNNIININKTFKLKYIPQDIPLVTFSKTDNIKNLDDHDLVEVDVDIDLDYQIINDQIIIANDNQNLDIKAVYNACK